MVKIICEKNKFVMGYHRVPVKLVANESLEVDDNNARYLTTQYKDIKYFIRPKDFTESTEATESTELLEEVDKKTKPKGKKIETSTD
jgi:hypothetical protein